MPPKLYVSGINIVKASRNDTNPAKMENDSITTSKLIGKYKYFRPKAEEEFMLERDFHRRKRN